MKIFCLHHKPLIERFNYLSNKFSELNLEVEWVTEYPPENLEFTQEDSFANKAELSLYYKHMHCLKEQYEKKIDFILIFEDDVLLPKDFNEYFDKCLKEFIEINGDILFLGSCCNIHPSEVFPNKYIYWEPNFLSRCAHCYIVALKGCEKIYPYLLNKKCAYDFKLNEIISKNNLISCYAEPAIYQGTEHHIYKSSLR